MPLKEGHYVKPLKDNGSLNMKLTEETGAQEAAVPMAAAASDRAEYIDAIPREYVEAPLPHRL